MHCEAYTAIGVSRTGISNGAFRTGPQEGSFTEFFICRSGFFHRGKSSLSQRAVVDAVSLLRPNKFVLWQWVFSSSISFRFQEVVNRSGESAEGTILIVVIMLVSATKEYDVRYHCSAYRSHSTKKNLSISMMVAMCLMFVLGACRIEGDVIFNEDGSMRTEMTFEDADGAMTKLGRDCTNLQKYISAVQPFLAEATYRDITPVGGKRKCKVTSSTPIENVVVKKKGNVYELKIAKQGRQGEVNGADMKMRLHVPGTVIKTTNGTVNGSQVTIEGIPNITKGVTITWKKGGNGPSQSTLSRAPARKAASSSPRGDGGSSVWKKIGIGGGVFAVVIGAVVVAARKKSKDKKAF